MSLNLNATSHVHLANLLIYKAMVVVQLQVRALYFTLSCTLDHPKLKGYC